MTKRVGILGGMFDPVHVGHLQAAKAARECCQLDEVLLVPCGNPVHRVATLTPCRQRCDMVHQAIAKTAWLQLDTRECDSPAPSRTRDTLAALKQEQPENILYFILGVDAFLSLHSWYHWQEIFSLAHLIVVTRPGYELASEAMNSDLQLEYSRRVVNSESGVVPEKSAGLIFIATMPTPELSSSHVRKLLRTGNKVAALLPPGVAEYIEAHHLYR